MALRITSEFKSDSSVYWKLEIYDSTTSTPGGGTWDVDGKGFDLTYQTETDDRFTGLVPSEVKFTCLVTTSGEQSIIDDIRGADAQRFQLKISRGVNGTDFDLYWVGNILNDINATQDASYPRKCTLTAIDGLASLKNIPFNQNTAYTSTALYSCKQYLINFLNNDVGTSSFWGSSDRFLDTWVDWSSSNMPTRAADKDPLQYSAFSPKAFIEISDDGQETWSDSYDFLNQFCKAWGARLFLSKGVWTFIQVNSYDEMDAASQFYRAYKKNGVILLSGTGTMILTEGSTYTRLGGNSFDYLPVLREVTATYDHLTSYNLTNDPIVLWNNYYDGTLGPGGYGIYNTAGAPLQKDLGAVVAVSGATISVQHSFNDGYVGTAANWNTLIDGNAGNTIYYRLKLVGSSTTYYANQTDSSWSTVGVFAGFDMDSPNSINGGAGMTGFYSYEANILSFETDELPVDGQLYIEAFAIIEYAWPTWNGAITGGGTQLASGETTVAPSIYVYAPPIIDSSQYVSYLLNGEVTTKRLFRNQNKPSGTLVKSSAVYDVGELLIGSGPTPSSWGRIRTSSDLTTWSNGTDSDWQSYGTGTTGEITTILVEEIMAGQSTGKRIFDGAIKIQTTNNMAFQHAIDLDGSIFVPYEVTFNANSDTWDGQWFQIETSYTDLNATTTDSPLMNEPNGEVNNFLW